MTQLKAEQPDCPGVITATRGNHGQSIALAGSKVGIKSTVLVPYGNSPEKNEAMRVFGAELIELVLLAAIITIHWPEWASGPGGMMRAFVLGDALFVAVRLFLGVLAPLGLGWMTWKTVQIRSIQSATGILYAAIVFVLFGEVISLYLSLATGQPF